MAKWVNDWNKEAYVNYSHKDLYDGAVKDPLTITPQMLLDNLSHLTEKERVKKVVYKGKLIPDGWVQNLLTDKPTDSEMVELVIALLREEIKTTIKVENIGNYDPENFEQIIPLLIEMCGNSKGNTFIQYTPGSGDDNKFKPVLDALGVGKKKRMFNPQGKDMKQEEYEELQPMQYDFVFEEIFRRANERCDGITNPDDYVYPNLFEEPSNEEHPIAIICEAAVTQLLKPMLQTNSAVLSSKYTNIFSRIGGAYRGGNKMDNKVRNSISVFPIYATVRTH